MLNALPAPGVPLPSGWPPWSRLSRKTSTRSMPLPWLALGSKATPSMNRSPFDKMSPGCGLPRSRTGGPEGTAAVVAACPAELLVAGAAAATGVPPQMDVVVVLSATGVGALDVIGVGVGAAPTKTGTLSLD